MGVSIGFIGCGNMAQAIIGGILRNKNIPEICVYDVDTEKYKLFNKEYVICLNDMNSVIKKSDYVFLAVKPQHIAGVFEEITADLSGKTVVSILAGVSTEYIRELAKIKDLKVIRIMPNTPLLVGEGASALCCTENVPDAEFNYIFSIFNSSGIAAKITENQMNEIININGSSPAYIFLFTMAVMKYAEQKGINYGTALQLFCQTLIGSAKMMLESGKTPEELKIMVTSPGGTTLAALNVFEDCGFVDIILKAFEACVKRAEELGK